MQGAGNALSERSRAQLLVLGIPPARQGRDELASMFPFNVDATGLDAEELAQVLIYLIERKLVSVGPKPRSLRKVQPGWHFCQFYRDFDDLPELLAPYVAEGLRNNEACLWVMPDAVPREAACEAVAKHVDDLEGYFATGQLEMLCHREWYLDGEGRLKTFEQIGAQLLDRQDRALTKGFKFLRAAGDTGWVSGSEESKNFIDYEMKINAALGSTKVAAMCTYRADVTSDELVAIVTAHQDARYIPVAA